MINWNRIKSISIHDVSPKHQIDLERIFNKLENINIRNKVIGIVPFWNYEWDIRDYPNFIQLMKKKEEEGWELALHGYTHSHPKFVPWYNRFLKFNESWEFYKLNYNDTKNLALKGLNIYKEAFGYQPKGFIPPNWKLSNKGYCAIKDIGFKYTTSIRYIKWFNKKWEKTPALFELPTLNQFISLFRLVYIRSNDFRLIIHPKDKIYTQNE